MSAVVVVVVVVLFDSILRWFFCRDATRINPTANPLLFFQGVRNSKNLRTLSRKSQKIVPKSERKSQNPPKIPKVRKKSQNPIQKKPKKSPKNPQNPQKKSPKINPKIQIFVRPNHELRTRCIFQLLSVVQIARFPGGGGEICFNSVMN